MNKDNDLLRASLIRPSRWSDAAAFIGGAAFGCIIGILLFISMGGWHA